MSVVGRVIPSCISSVARETNRDEHQVMQGLYKEGNLLFTEESFSRLIDSLSHRILKGTAALSLSVKALSKINIPRPIQFGTLVRAVSFPEKQGNPPETSLTD